MARTVIKAVKKMKPKQQKTLLILLIAAIVICGIYISMGDPAGLLAGYEQVLADPPVMAGAPPAAEEPGDTAAAPGVDGILDAYVLDVGQGDAIFLRSPSGKTMLIDTGTSSGWGNLNGFLSENDIKKLDVVIATHPHEDHIGSMQKVILNYEIGAFYMPDAATNTRVFEKMLDALDERDIKVISAESGKMIEWDEQVEIRILGPIAGKTYKNLNDYSVMCRVKFGETAIMLTGDAEEDAEEDAMHESPASYFAATVLKSGHHGSRTSSGEPFLDAVNPSFAVISCGAGNSYNHPHQETTDKLTARGIPWYRTDERGIIHIAMDGSTAKVETEK